MTADTADVIIEMLEGMRELIGLYEEEADTISLYREHLTERERDAAVFEKNIETGSETMQYECKGSELDYSSTMDSSDVIEPSKIGGKINRETFLRTRAQILSQNIDDDDSVSELQKEPRVKIKRGHF